MVGRLEELVGRELSRAVEVERARSLVSRECDNLLHARVDRGLDDVLRANDIGLHVLERVVFGRVDLLQGRRVNHIVDLVHGASQPVLVANVADEPAQSGVVVEPLAHFVLFEFVAGVDHDAAGVVLLEQQFDERFAEGACPSGDEDRRSL